MPPHRPNPQFETTQWTQLLKSHQTLSERADNALTILCESYRSPVYAFILRKKGNPAEAEDLTQSFFASLIEKKSYRHADRQRGKFRTFLLASVKNFLHNHHRNQTNQKRGGSLEHVSLDSPALADISDDSQSPCDSYFDQEWAVSIFDGVWKLLQNEYTQAGQADRFHLLRGTLTQSGQAIPYEELAAQLDITPNGVKSATFRMRRRFRDLFRATVAQVVENPADVDGEIRYLMNILIQNPRNQDPKKD